MTSCISAVRQIGDLIYPTSCCACETAAAGSNAPMCERCLDQHCRVCSEAYCPACGMPLAEAGSPCPYCSGKGIPHFEQVVRLGLFRDPLKRLIHQMKYHRRWTLTEFLTDELTSRPADRTRLQCIEVFIPIPLHPWRHFQRGYNQADLIARRLARGVGSKVAQPAARIRRTTSQAGLHSHAKRVENLRDAFAMVRPQDVKGLNIAVVDDVMTTGATLQAFARTLAPAGPASMTAVVLAIADPRHSDFQSI